MTKIIDPSGNPFGQNSAIIDARGAILLDNVDVVMLTEPDERRLVGLQLSGRVNKSSARSEVLYLFDEDGAAAIVAASHRARGDPAVTTYGMCTACGSVEVALNQVTGTRDLSDIGESSAYPTGFGCEVCA